MRATALAQRAASAAKVPAALPAARAHGNRSRIEGRARPLGARGAFWSGLRADAGLLEHEAIEKLNRAEDLSRAERVALGEVYILQGHRERHRRQSHNCKPQPLGTPRVNLAFRLRGFDQPDARVVLIG